MNLKPIIRLLDERWQPLDPEEAPQRPPEEQEAAVRMYQERLAHIPNDIVWLHSRIGGFEDEKDLVEMLAKDWEGTVRQLHEVRSWGLAYSLFR